MAPKSSKRKSSEPPSLPKNPAVSSPAPQPSKPSTAKKSRVEKSPPVAGYAATLLERQRLVLTQLSPRYLPVSVLGLESQRDALTALLERTIAAQQNNACVLLGFPGSGKSLLYEFVTRALRSEYAAKHGKSFVEIRLNGHLHSDDTLAMRSLVEQLSRDYEIEGPGQFETFSQLLDRVYKFLNTGQLEGIPVFFLIEDFHLFAQRPKQTLLYNLSDLLQVKTAQLAIIGITNRLDVFETLEKRVRSRLFYRRFFFSHIENKEILVKILQNALEIQLPEKINQNNQTIFPWIFQQKQTGKEKKERENNEDSPTIALQLDSSAVSYNKGIAELFADPEMMEIIDYYYKLGKPVQFFFTALSLLVAQINDRTNKGKEGASNGTSEESSVNPIEFQFPSCSSKNFSLGVPSIAQFHRCLSYLDRPWLEYSLFHCSVMEISLLTAALHLARKFSAESVNFQLIYEEFVKFHSSRGLMESSRYSKRVCMKGFEHLFSLGLLVWNSLYFLNSNNTGISGLASPASSVSHLNYQERQFRAVRVAIGENEFREFLQEKAEGGNSTPAKGNLDEKTPGIEIPTWLRQWALKTTTE